mgnify:CR=1 FL=1
MSKEQTSGEDLIDKVEQETVETKEQTETTPAFDPKAFVGEETNSKEEPQKEEVEEQEETTNEEESDDDSFSWDKVELDSEEKQESKIEEDEDWDSTPVSKEETKKSENVKEEVYDWQTLASEIGVEAKDEKTFKEAVKRAISEPSPVNDTIQNLQAFLKMNDAQLVASDLEASGLEKEEIKDTVDRMHDSGLLKKEALLIRKNLQNYIANERKTIKQEEEKLQKETETKNIENRKALQTYIKTKEDFFGGKVGKTEKKELYNYITSGDFSKELYGSAANVADAAFLWKYKDKIFKMLSGQGVERGKASVIDKITNPNLSRKSRHVETKMKNGFDPVEFMK